MSETKSKPFEYTQDAGHMGTFTNTYTVTVTDGEISAIETFNDTNDLYLPVRPGTDLFTALSKTDEALDTISINTTGQTGNVSKTVLQDREQLDQNYAKLEKKYNNRVAELNETTEDTGGPVATQNASVSPGKPSTLRYPYDIDDNQDHLKIQQFEYERPGTRDARLYGTPFPSVGNVQASRPASSPGPLKDGYREADTVKGKPFGKYGGTVLLPMPKVSDSNGAEWGKSDLNVFGLGFTSIAGGIIDAAMGKNVDPKFEKLQQDLFKNEKQDIDNIAQGNALRQNIIGNQDAGINNLQGMGQAGLAIGAQELSKFAGVNLSADEVLARTSGKILNPNAELLFQGPVLRDFGFKFLMIARGEDEAEEIRKIIRFFKIGAAPVYSDGPALLGTPNVFQLEYKAGNRNLDTVNKFNEMALRTITVDYAPDGFWSAYQDSHPVAVVMSLQFSELRPLYRRDHENASGVGY